MSVRCSTHLADSMIPTIMGKARLRQRQSSHARDVAILVTSLLAGGCVSLLLASRRSESFWPNFLFYWLSQTLPLTGMLLLGGRAILIAGSATGLICFLVLYSSLNDQSGGWLFYVFGAFGASIFTLIVSDSCRIPWVNSAIAYTVGMGAVAAGAALPLIFFLVARHSM